MINRINSDLANDLGNLCQRVLSFIAKNGGGVVPAPGDYTDEDRWLDKAIDAEKPLIWDAFEKQAFHKALESIWSIVGEANRYVDAQAPWTLRKSDPQRMETVLYVLAEVLRELGATIQPFMPESAAKLLDQLGVPAGDRAFANLGETGALKPGAALPAPEGIFPRYIDPTEVAPPKAGAPKAAKR
jgi:methionyl-tRNA synthetase